MSRHACGRAVEGRGRGKTIAVGSRESPQGVQRRQQLSGCLMDSFDDSMLSFASQSANTFSYHSQRRSRCLMLRYLGFEDPHSWATIMPQRVRESVCFRPLLANGATERQSAAENHPSNRCPYHCLRWTGNRIHRHLPRPRD